MESNVHKMREALECAKKKALYISRNYTTPNSLTGNILELLAHLNAALSAPPRNCDRFSDELDAQLAFLNEVWLISVDRDTMIERDRYENWTDEMRARYGRWLLAQTEEKEGDGIRWGLG